MSKAALFSALSEPEQTYLLANLAHQLTLYARDGYEPGTERLSNLELVRRLNEVQHRVTAAICDRLANHKERYPDDVLINIVAGHDSDKFGRYLHSAFRRSWKMAFGAELPSDLP